MSEPRKRRRDFDPSYTSMGYPMYWLWKRGVPLAHIADMFGKTVNSISVNATNQSVVVFEPSILAGLEKPDFSIAQPELIFPKESGLEDLEAEVELEASQFWKRVRGLMGNKALGRFLQKINKPGQENVSRMRLRARVLHLTAELYLHAGYLTTAKHFCRRSLSTHLELYKQTQSRTELFHYAKSMLIYTCALNIAGDSKPTLPLLRLAEQAFEASKAKMDPELHRQRASTLLDMARLDQARASYRLAFDTYPAHMEFRGLEGSEHARHDVGMRPLSVMNRDFDGALRDLEIAQHWPDGDIHRSINLNAAIAAGFLSGSEAIQVEALKLLPAARLAGHSYGRQSTAVSLLELISRVPKKHQMDWARFAIRYNAYRNR